MSTSATLPPGLEALSSHTFGHFTMALRNLPRSNQITKFRPLFFGAQQGESYFINKTEKYRASVITNLWSFYLYLSDMHRLQIELIDESENHLKVHLEIKLKSIATVLTPTFTSGSIISASWQRETVHDAHGRAIGSIEVLLETQFNKDVHQQIKEIMDFNSLLVFEGISPINSETELPRQPPQQSTVWAGADSAKTSNNDEKFFKAIQSSVKIHEEQQSRMLEEDIDRMIMEMQTKPYDFSRYQENEVQKKIVQSKEMVIAQSKEMGNSQSKTIRNSQSKTIGANKTAINFHEQTNDSGALRPQFETLTNFKQHSTNSRPPMMRSQNRNSDRSASQSKNKSKSNEKQSNLTNNSNKSEILIKIHQLLISGNTEQVKQFSIRVYLNDDSEQHFSSQGIRQGENIVFQQKLKLRNINQLRQIRFLLFDDYGQSQGEGIFSLSRLYVSPNQKGIFMVPILIPTPQNLKKITASVRNITPILDTPPHCTLRIEAQLIQRIEIVQIFLRISNFNIPFNLIRYKIPFTKQTIEFTEKQHCNIFPHNRIQDTILIELWRNQQVIGLSKISLKKIIHVNEAVLNMNSEPTFLYDGLKQIRDAFNDEKIVGKFQLELAFGSVKQIQTLLQGMSRGSQKKREVLPKIEATLDQRLGVFLKEKKNMVQASVQAEVQEIPKQQQILQNCEQSSFYSNNQFLSSGFTQTIKKQEQIYINKEQQIKLKETKRQINEKSVPTLTMKVCNSITEVLQPILPFLDKIKAKCKPHLLYNFIERSRLQNILLSFGISANDVQQIFQSVLIIKSEMVNVNALYDFCMCLQIDKQIKPSLIGDELLIQSAIKLLYQDEKKRQSLLLESDMDFHEMRALFAKVDIKITLHQFETIAKYMSKFAAKADCLNLRANTVRKLEEKVVMEMRQKFYEEDIVHQIYGENSEILTSNEESVIEEQPIVGKQQAWQVPKETKYNTCLTIDGLEGIKQSAECLFDRAVTNTNSYLRVVIDSPTFEQIMFNKETLSQNITTEIAIEDVDGRAELCLEGKVIACAPFSLIKGVKSVYAMKSKEGEFCGLLHIGIS